MKSVSHGSRSSFEWLPWSAAILAILGVSALGIYVATYSPSDPRPAPEASIEYTPETDLLTQSTQSEKRALNTAQSTFTPPLGEPRSPASAQSQELVYAWCCMYDDNARARGRHPTDDEIFAAAARHFGISPAEAKQCFYMGGLKLLEASEK
jgi:hypothetical protein